jgi:hypothetical protein
MMIFCSTAVPFSITESRLRCSTNRRDWTELTGNNCLSLIIHFGKISSPSTDIPSPSNTQQRTPRPPPQLRPPNSLFIQQKHLSPLPKPVIRAPTRDIYLSNLRFPRIPDIFPVATAAVHITVDVVFDAVGDAGVADCEELAVS